MIRLLTVCIAAVLLASVHSCVAVDRTSAGGSKPAKVVVVEKNKEPKKPAKKVEKTPKNKAVKAKKAESSSWRTDGTTGASPRR